MTFDPSSEEKSEFGGFDIFLMFLDVIIDVAIMGFLSKFYQFLMRNDLINIAKCRKIYVCILIVANLLFLLEILTS